MKGPATLPSLPPVPLVSVIIPCYNQGHFLSEAIESALRQTHPSIEIVVVDDGSTDDTSAIATSYKGIRCVRQTNRGLAAARNRGVQESSGNCLVFLDADDRLRSQAVALGLRCLRDCSRAAFSYGQCDLIDVDGKLIGSSARPILQGDHYLRLLHGNFLPNPAAIIFRRDTLEAVGGFRSGFPGVEDYDLCLRLTRVYTACGYPEVIADYRQHAASLSRKAAVMSDSMLGVLRSQDKYVSGLRQYRRALRQGMRSWRRKYYADLLVTRARENAREGQWALVARDVLSLLRSNPRLLLDNALGKLRVRRLRDGRSR